MIEALAKVAEVAAESAEASSEAEIDPDARIDAENTADGADAKEDVDPNARIGESDDLMVKDSDYRIGSDFEGPEAPTANEMPSRPWDGEIDPDARIETENAASEIANEADARSDESIEYTASEVDDSRVDDNGNIYKDENGELLPNTEYEINGTRYTTDDLGRITHAEGYLEDTPENERDNAAQSDAGGKDRKSGDDGGHLRARMNGGSSGNENLVPMRDTINRGDYKQSENEENQMLKDGKQVYEKIDVTYDDDSARPSKIDKAYTDGEKTVKLTVDNVEGSTDLLEGIEGEISDQDLSNLKAEIADMQADGNVVSVTSVRREYDSEGNLKSVTVGVTNETTTPREKNYTTYSPKA